MMVQKMCNHTGAPAVLW